MGNPFEHFDCIAALEPDAMLIVTGRVYGVPIEGGRIDLPIGTKLRVKHVTGVLWATAAIDGRAKNVTISPDLFDQVEPIT